ncbi:unnamed protein product [Leuciscus chuanchicus]
MLHHAGAVSRIANMREGDPSVQTGRCEVSLNPSRLRNTSCFRVGFTSSIKMMQISLGRAKSPILDQYPCNETNLRYGSRPSREAVLIAASLAQGSADES